jgi:hypothetical protein
MAHIFFFKRKRLQTQSLGQHLKLGPRCGLSQNVAFIAGLADLATKMENSQLNEAHG